MAKLKRVVRTDPKEDMYHCCRWCKWSHFEDYSRKCYHKDNSISEEGVPGVYEVSENGYLSETLEETLNNEKLVKELMFNIESIFDKWNISQKKKKEFEDHFREVWGSFADTSLKEVLDENISVLYQSKLEEYYAQDTPGVIVSDDFCCKYFE